MEEKKLTGRNKTRRDILIALQDCANTKPLSSITMREIAAASNISHSKIFYYFESKEHMFLNYVKYVEDEYVNFFEKWLSKVKEKSIERDNKLDMVIELLEEFVNYNGDVYAVSFSQIQTLSVYNEELSEAVNHLFKHWFDLVSEILEIIYEEPMNNIAEVFFIMSEGLCSTSVRKGKMYTTSDIKNIFENIKGLV